jgi:hypothetical protein
MFTSFFFLVAHVACADAILQKSKLITTSFFFVVGQKTKTTRQPSSQARFKSQEY